MMMFHVMRQNVRFISNVTREMKGKLKTKPNLAFKIRSMRLEDIPQIVELGRQERFQFPASSLKYWLTQDPDGMKIAVTESGEIIGSLFNIKNNERLYIGGVFCVQEKFRHLDVGRKLLQACDDHSEGINIGVNTDIHRPYYRNELPSGVEILAFQNSLLPAIYEYDYSLAGYERKSLIEASCHEENSRTLVAMKDGKCVGFGSIKLNIMEIGRIGPLYTDDPSVAEAMVKRLIPAMPEAKGFTTVTINTNLYANMVLEKLKIPIHSSLYRLYREERFHVDTKRVFAHFDIDFTPV
ncbi:n-acetyltransferase domain-containing protein [Trichonephila clavata]|uniref:N-acetyltransferase domain-containing protein n=1 Tax=Trichonephila clavata TaxID=2740835 RepID=A0A8X6L1V3_TRICU|nr:n-acetyltransferase domain-containing protein [Trichonephila clavata]